MKIIIILISIISITALVMACISFSKTFKHNRERFIDKNIDLIIAHYNESLDWLNNYLNKFNKIYIYHKGDQGEEVAKKFPKAKVVKLPNQGRESDTYFYHIINNYDRLQDYNLFLQGDPMGHTTLERLNNAIEKNIDTIGGGSIKSDAIDLNTTYPSLIHIINYNCSHGQWLNPKFKKFVQEYWGDRPNIKFSAGAQFIVSKENIQKHPISIYKKFKELNLTHTDWPYIFERVWSLIFGDYPIQFE